MDGSDRDRVRRFLSHSDNPLVRAIGRVPITVQRKLLVAFAIVIVLLVTVGVLGLRVLSESNDRVQPLGQLPPRVATYGELQLDSLQLRQQLLHRDDLLTCGDALSCQNPGPTFRPNGDLVAATDATIASTLLQIGPLSDAANLSFVPPSDEGRILSEIHSEYVRISTATPSIFANDRAGKYSDNPLQDDEAGALEGDANQLVNVTATDAAHLIAQNQVSYLDSQHLFIGVAAGSVVLALLLAFILSGALIGPIKQVRARLAAIAAGDFSGEVDVPNRDELGALAADLNLMNDQLGRLYRELENVSRHKSEFLANMSHELRTPLNAVIGFSEVLQDRLFGDLNDKQAEYVTDINTSGRHLLTLINDILDLSKVEAGRMELQATTFALSDALENAVALTRERATRQGISLRLTVDPSAGAIDADERKIKQVLFNLLTNALKFTARGGTVDVIARGEGDEVLVSVRDDGVGIAEADQVRIFEEFQQVRTSQLQEGTGLGLALSRRFVELHGGRLWVQSVPGQGSTFAFTLPRARLAGTGGLIPPAGAGTAVSATAALS
jgi:signal transduction histidine kinase